MAETEDTRPPVSDIYGIAPDYADNHPDSVPAPTTQDERADLIVGVLELHYKQAGWSPQIRYGEDTNGQWRCGCGAKGTPRAGWGGVTDGWRRHVAREIAKVLP